MKIYTGNVVEELMRGFVSKESQYLFNGDYSAILNAALNLELDEKIVSIVSERIQTKLCEEVYSAHAYRNDMRWEMKGMKNIVDKTKLYRYTRKIVSAERMLMRYSEWPDVLYTYEDFKSTRIGYSYRGDIEIVKERKAYLKFLEPDCSMNSYLFCMGIRHACNMKPENVIEFYEYVLDNAPNILVWQQMIEEYAGGYLRSDAVCPITKIPEKQIYVG